MNQFITRSYLIISIVILVLFLFPGCQNPPRTPAGKLPETNSDVTGTTENNGTLPDLFVNDEPFSSSEPIHVTRNSITKFRWVFPDSQETELAVLYPGKSMPEVIERWDSQEFDINLFFPFGESKIFLNRGKSRYSWEIISSISPFSEENPNECAPCFMAMTSGTQWFYKEYSDETLILDWVYELGKWEENSDGNRTAILTMTATSPESGQTVRTAVLSLVCTMDGPVFVSVTESDGKTELVTLYDKDTLFMPPSIRLGDHWTRKGKSITKANGKDSEVEIEESFVCIGEKTVNVPLGEYKSLEVEYTIRRKYNDKTYLQTGRTYYVPELGRVKTISEGDKILTIVLDKIIQPKPDSTDTENIIGSENSESDAHSQQN